MAMFCAFLLVSPYALYQLFRFVSPALYSNERKYVVRVLAAATSCSLGSGIELFPYFSADLPFFRYLSSQCRCTEFYFVVVLY
jgi:sec-independent protein translocase protein TatC